MQKLLPIGRGPNREVFFIMALWELFIIALGLSMDAFAVAIGKGLTVGSDEVGRSRNLLGKCALTGLYFGGFQALMPLAGYFAGAHFEKYVVRHDHWIAFILLTVIGLGMIRGACSKGDAPEKDGNSFAFKTMLLLSVATSIDALAVGVSFAFLNVRIVPAVSFIGVITFVLSFLGVRIGSIFGLRFKRHAELAGGIILILMGLKILIEHLTGGT